MSVDVFVLFGCIFSLTINVVSYFENIPSLQSSAIGLTVAHVSVGISKSKIHARKHKRKCCSYPNNRRKHIIAVTVRIG